MFGCFAPSEIHDRGTLLPFSDSLRETVWKVGGGFLIACLSCFKRARWDIFALFWLLAILLIEAYWDFPDSLRRGVLRSSLAGCCIEPRHKPTNRLQRPAHTEPSNHYV